MNQNYIVRPDTTHALAKFCLDFKTGRKFGKALHEPIPYHSKKQTRSFMGNQNIFVTVFFIQELYA